jgi:hypothetical protein
MAEELKPEAYRRHLDACLTVVERELVSGSSTADIELVQSSLGTVATIVRANPGIAGGSELGTFLHRLTRLYAPACDRRESEAFTTTATEYGAVVAAISHRHPELDYTAALGQLLELMTRLFAARDNNWKAVYQLLRSIPESNKAKQILSKVCAADIREWFDAGVQNLFSLQNDLISKIEALEREAEETSRRMQVKSRRLRELRRRNDPDGTGKVVVLEGILMERRLQALAREKEQLLAEKAGRESTLGLIESDILEFENRLREARRLYYLRVV